jgi:hypothetical protein
MVNKYILDENGDPVPAKDVVEWGKWFETADRVVAKDRLPSGHEVSTVFLGLDHSFSTDPAAEPLLFETMVFRPGSRSELDCARYSTKAEALVGHKEMVALWTEKIAAGDEDEEEEEDEEDPDDEDEDELDDEEDDFDDEDDEDLDDEEDEDEDEA